MATVTYFRNTASVLTLEFCSDNLEVIVKPPNNDWKTEQLPVFSSSI